MNQSRSKLSLTSPVLYISEAFLFIESLAFSFVVFYVISQIRFDLASRFSVFAVIGRIRFAWWWLWRWWLWLRILWYVLFSHFFCVFTILLVVLVAWGLEFLYQRESSPNMIFFCLLCSYKKESNPKLFESSKYFGAQISCSLSKLENQVYSYSHDLNLPSSFLPLSLHQKHDPVHSNGFHPYVIGFW